MRHHRSIPANRSRARSPHAAIALRATPRREANGPLLSAPVTPAVADTPFVRFGAAAARPALIAMGPVPRLLNAIDRKRSFMVKPFPQLAKSGPGLEPTPFATLCSLSHGRPGSLALLLLPILPTS